MAVLMQVHFFVLDSYIHVVWEGLGSPALLFGIAFVGSRWVGGRYSTFQGARYLTNNKGAEQVENG